MAFELNGNKHDDQTVGMIVLLEDKPYKSIWSAINTEQNREAVATSLVSLVQTPFPVYKKISSQKRLKVSALVRYQMVVATTVNTN